MLKSMKNCHNFVLMLRIYHNAW